MRLVHGNKWRGRSAENVIAELDEIVFKYKAKHLFILDDNFTFIPDRAKKILQHMIINNYKIRWNTPNGISAKNIDLEMAQLMKKSGCANVCIAIETGSEYIRNEIMNKKLSNSEIEYSINNLNKGGIPIIGFLMVGMPEEDKFQYNETFKFVSKLPLTSVTVSHAIPFPGTQLFNDLIEANVISNDFELIGDYYNTPPYETTHFTKQDLIERKKQLTNLFPKLSILEEIEKAGHY
jgi:magnesium-protoporphyrin IX monomethyl ester (oxidative) cyclase